MLGIRVHPAGRSIESDKGMTMAFEKLAESAERVVNEHGGVQGVAHQAEQLEHVAASNGTHGGGRHELLQALACGRAVTTIQIRARRAGTAT
jgi:hypothetical protein